MEKPAISGFEIAGFARLAAVSVWLIASLRQYRP